MLGFANELVTRAARFITAAQDDCPLWTVSVRGRAVGALVREAGQWRLNWFGTADPRLANYSGLVDGDVDALAEALSFRLGAPVRLEAFGG
jgi:hypothetical protein